MAHTARPDFRARRQAVAAGHYLAAMAGHDILRDGGNAADAAAAVAFCLSVLEPHQNGPGGECPALVHFGGKTYAVSGQGASPGGLTLEWFRERGYELIPGDGLLPATVPAHVGTWLLILREFGSLPLARILEPAIELAETGFIVYQSLAETIEMHSGRFRGEWPTSAEVYLPEGRAPKVGDTLRLPAVAETFRRMRNESARKSDRVQGLQAAYDWFYRGQGAAIIESFCRSTKVCDSAGRESPGFLTQEDVGTWRPRLEEPVRFTYRGVEVCKCGPWTQGPVFLQQLAILQHFDLRAMGWGTAAYFHTIIEAARLAFADREAWYGDPDFDDVPLERLLSPAYNRQRAALVDPRAAAPELRPGDPFQRRTAPDVSSAVTPPAGEGCSGGSSGDTTHLDVVDRWGNCVSATPSGGWLQSSPVIPDLGFPLGTRGQMFYLDPSRANCYAPRKRPRTTLTPSLALQGGRPWLVFGTPGGDGQDQWSLQVFLNIVEFGMDPARAVEAPTVTVQSFPSSFYPRQCFPLRVSCESRIKMETLKTLQQWGHEVHVDPPYAHGRPSVLRLEEDGSVTGAITSRLETGYVTGW
ncbi:MAG: gamma-glutamyltransferase family protein [Armatimonadota bacterium]